jgi:Flp pilus assembly protein TadD
VNPGSPQALQTLTVLLIGARRVDEAEPLLEKLLASDGPAAANGFMQLGRLLASNPDRKQNLEVVGRLARKHRKLPEAHFAIAQAAIAAEDEARALAAIREASSLRPEWELAALFEAQVLQRAKPDAAIARLAAFLARYPDSREVRLNYARALVGERKYDEARAEFDKLVAANPGNPDLIYAVGLLAVQAREYGVAEGNLKRALELGFRDANAARFTLGQIAEERKDFASARDWYRSVTPGDHYLPSRVRYAQTLSREGNLDEARRFLRLQAAGESQATPFVIAEAQILRDAGKHSDAYELLGQALVKSPDQAELLYDHALTAEKLDRFDVLESNLRKLIQMQPKHAHAYNALGYSLADRNLRLDEAKTLIAKALELAPDDASIIDSMGWALYRMGDLQGVLEYLRRAFRGRQDGEIAAHLGEVLWMSGARDEASRIWDDTLKNHPADEILLKTIRRLRK